MSSEPNVERVRRAGLWSGWMPSLLVGASAGIAAEVAVTILLYAGPGLMRALTTVLAVEGAALALGLQTAPRRTERLLESIRRRWLFCLVAFMAAALYGTAWSLFEAMGGGRWGQGVGLALLAGLPMFACGAVLGGMGALATADAWGRTQGPSAPAALGAALGFVVTGALLPRAPIPASLLVGCLVLLSAGGMIYGAVLAAAGGAEESAASAPIGPGHVGSTAVDPAPVGPTSVGAAEGDVPAQ
jgi:hypothetical protein